MNKQDEAKENYLISYQTNIEISGGDVYINDAKQDLEQKKPLEFAQQATRTFYSRFLKSHFENLILLTGAGSSIGIGKNGKTGKTRIELWDSIKKVIGIERLKKFANRIQINFPEENDVGDVEEILSKAYIAREFIKPMEGDDPHDGIDLIISEIQKQIIDDCSLELPDDSPHELILARLTSRKVKLPRVKIFTLNYDTLFEQAAQKNSHIVIDGFSFSNPRIFNGVNYDYDMVIRENSRIDNEENYVPHVFHLYKPHGSLNWAESDGRIIIDSSTKTPLIIYPKNSKYESSYEQPFFEMISRFQQAIRLKNALLIVIGFSFYDKHIKSMIFEAVKANPSFRLLIVNLGIGENEYLRDFRELARTRNNVILINETFKNFSFNFPYPDTYKNLTLKIKKEDLEEHLEN